MTSWGRAAAVALMTMGVGIFGVLASYLANLFLPDTTDDDASADLGGSVDLDEIRSELAALNRRLDDIQASLGDAAPPGDRRE